MKRLAILLLFVAGCSVWPSAHRDVVELGAVHRIYREHVVPRSASETADVNRLGDRIDNILRRMEEVSK